MFEQSISVDRMEQAVSLFGSFDENIKMIEKEFDLGDKGHGRGRECLKGRARDKRTSDAHQPRRGAQRPECPLCHLARQRGQRGSASADDCGLHLHHFKGQTGQAENARSEEIYRSHPHKHGHSRRRTRRHRQNLSCGRHGGDGFSSKGSQPYNSYPPRR